MKNNNNNSIYNNHFTVKINEKEVKSDENGLDIMLKRVQPHNVDQFKKKIMDLIQGEENISEYKKKLEKSFNDYFTIPNISRPIQPYLLSINEGTELYRVVHDDNKKYEYGRPAEEVDMLGRLNEKHERCIYFSFSEKTAKNEAKGWSTKSSNQNLYLTKYIVKQDFEIEFINYVEFQSHIFSKKDRHIAKIHSEIRNYFLLNKAPENDLKAEKFYILTNLIKNLKIIGNSNGLVFISSLMKNTDMEYSVRMEGRITYNPNANLVLYDSNNKKIEDLIRRTSVLKL